MAQHTAHGSAVIIKSNIRHYAKNNFNEMYMQATSIVIEDWTGPITVSAIYSPPKYTIKREQYESFFNTLGERFIAAGDYNAKHVHWGSRLVQPKGRELYEASVPLGLDFISTGEPTYWPSDTNKIPDLIDFAVVKGIHKRYFRAESCLELSSDHSPVLLTLSSKVITKCKPYILHNNKTNWLLFRELVTVNLNTQISLKSEADITKALEHFNQCIQYAAWDATPQNRPAEHTSTCSPIISSILAEKRIRKRWQVTRCPELKTKLNKLTKETKKLLLEHRNRGVKKYLQNLSATTATNYSLWKATKGLK